MTASANGFAMRGAYEPPIRIDLEKCPASARMKEEITEISQNMEASGGGNVDADYTNKINRATLRCETDLAYFEIRESAERLRAMGRETLRAFGRDAWDFWRTPFFDRDYDQGERIDARAREIAAARRFMLEGLGGAALSFFARNRLYEATWNPEKKPKRGIYRAEQLTTDMRRAKTYEALHLPSYSVEKVWTDGSAKTGDRAGEIRAGSEKYYPILFRRTSLGKDLKKLRKEERKRRKVDYLEHKEWRDKARADAEISANA
jgi:hypothetical protein